jgi:hypothetical protein
MVWQDLPSGLYDWIKKYKFTNSIRNIWFAKYGCKGDKTEVKIRNYKKNEIIKKNESLKER